jgi:hypothetical protein
MTDTKGDVTHFQGLKPSAFTSPKEWNAQNNAQPDHVQAWNARLLIKLLEESHYAGKAAKTKLSTAMDPEAEKEQGKIFANVLRLAFSTGKD